MAKETRRAYMDACCFSEAAAFDIQKHKPERDMDIRFIRALFESAFDQEIELFTSSLSVAECQYVADDGTLNERKKIMTDEVKQCFKTMLTSGRFVILVQDTILVAEQARDLLWVHGVSLPGADAVHVASAIQQRCEEFITFDAKHIRKRASELKEIFGLNVISPRESEIIPKSKRPDPGPLFTAATETVEPGSGAGPDEGA